MGLGLKRSFYEEDNVVVTGVASVGEEQVATYRRPPYLNCVGGLPYMQFRIFTQTGVIVVLHPLEGDTWQEEADYCAENPD